MRRRTSLIILAIASLIACSGPRHDLPAADAASCSVYRAFYAQTVEQEGVYFNSTATPLPPIAGGQFGRNADRARELHLEGPREFLIEQFQRDLSIDTSTYFDELNSAPTSIRSCFGDGPPYIHDGSLDQAWWREALRTMGQNTDVTLTVVSPVAFSSDGRLAILYASYYCGGLCGGGSFYVFEKGSTWTQVGFVGVWVS